MKRYLILVGVALAILGVDQGTKIWAEQNLASRFPGRQSQAKPIELTVSEGDGETTLAGLIDSTYSLTSLDEAERMVSRRLVSVNGFVEQSPGKELAPGDRVTIHERQVEVVPGFWTFKYVENRGAAWGFLSWVEGWWRVPFFVLVSFLAMGMLVYLAAKAPPTARLFNAGLGLLMGGAVGNFIDRVRLSYVIDFIDWYHKGYHWPTFNVADAAITVGVVIIFLEMIFGQGKDLLTPPQGVADDGAGVDSVESPLAAGAASGKTKSKKTE